MQNGVRVLICEQTKGKERTLMRAVHERGTFCTPLYITSSLARKCLEAFNVKS